MSVTPSRITGSSREFLSNIRELSGVRPGWSGVVGRPSQIFRVVGSFPECLGVVRSPSQIYGSGREGLPDVWEWSGDPLECLGGSLGCPGVVGRPSKISGSGWEALLDDQK